MDIKDFRIKEKKLIGITIQRKIYKVYMGFRFLIIPVIKGKYIWEDVDKFGNELLYNEPLEIYVSHKEAIRRIDDICAPEKLYYSDQFESIEYIKPTEL